MNYFFKKEKCRHITIPQNILGSNDYDGVKFFILLHEVILKELEWFFKGSYYNWLEVEVHNGHLNIAQHF